MRLLLRGLYLGLGGLRPGAVGLPLLLRGRERRARLTRVSTRDLERGGDLLLGRLRRRKLERQGVAFLAEL